MCYVFLKMEAEKKKKSTKGAASRKEGMKGVS
jgi:hypothetical protein